MSVIGFIRIKSRKYRATTAANCPNTKTIVLVRRARCNLIELRVDSLALKRPRFAGFRALNRLQDGAKLLLCLMGRLPAYSFHVVSMQGDARLLRGRRLLLNSANHLIRHLWRRFMNLANVSCSLYIAHLPRAAAGYRSKGSLNCVISSASSPSARSLRWRNSPTKLSIVGSAD